MDRLPGRLMVLSALLLSAAPLAAQDEGQERIEILVRLFGSEDEARRDAAARELLAIGRPARGALREAARSGNAELQRRVNETYPYVRWGVRSDCPPPILELLGRLESSRPEDRARVLDQIARIDSFASREALVAGWWDVEDAQSLARLAMDPKLDPEDVEKRLKAVRPEDSPAILRARAAAFVRRAEDLAACELFARIGDGDADRDLLEGWGEALFRLRRYAEAAEVFSRVEGTDAPPPMHHAESLYRLGRLEEAGAVLPRCIQGSKHDQATSLLREFALAYGSPRLLVEGPASGATPREVAARAWIRLGALDRAEEAWREIEDEDDRRRVLGLLLEARGEASILTPAFAAEAHSLRPEDAERHRRLARALEKDDPASALAEWRKARFLDRSCEECEPAIERLKGASHDRAGCWTREATAPPPHLAFATSPVRLGGSWYYTNSEGDLIKTKDPLRPEPSWLYTPPRPVTAWDRDTSLLGWSSTPALAIRGSELLCLFARSCQVQQPKRGGTGWIGGCTLRVLDDASGREVWSREFPYYMTPGRLWPAAGVVTFVRDGLAVFDLDTRAWRWTLSDVGHGGAAVWVDGDAVYLGFPSGDLCRLRLADGTLVWKKKWPGAPSGPVLLVGAGRRLLFRPSGLALVALSLDDDSVLWERQPSSISSQEVVVDEDRAYLQSRMGGGVEALSLATGEVAWKTQAGRLDWFDTCLVSDQALWLGGAEGLLCLDKSSGRILGASWGERTYSSTALYLADGATLLRSTAMPQPPWIPDYGRRPPKFSSTRLVEGDAPAPGDLPGDEDVLAEVSLLEDVCYGAGAQDGAVWLALADACARAGHLEWGAEALRQGLLLTAPDVARLHVWLDRIADAIGPEEDRPDPLLGLAADLRRREAIIEVEESLRSGVFPPPGDSSSPSPWDYADLVLDAAPDLEMRRATALLGRGLGTAQPFVARFLGDVPEPLAIEGLDAILRMGFRPDDCSRIWPGSRLDGTSSNTADLEAALRARWAGPAGALRGASLAVLELLTPVPPKEDDEASLRAAFAAELPRIRLAAAASLSRRGIAEGREAILEELHSGSDEARTFAVWLAGNLRMKEAVAELPLDPDQPGQYDLEALAEIGTEEAIEKVLRAAAKADPSYPWPHVLPLSRVRTDEAVRVLQRLSSAPDFGGLVAGFYGLVWMDTPRSRLAAIEPARAYLRLDPMGDSALHAVTRGLLELGDVPGAEACLARLEACGLSTPWSLALRSRVLAARGDLEGAREARRCAEEDLDRSEAVHPGSWRHKLTRAKLYLHPAEIADPEKARKLVEEARTLGALDSDLERLLEVLQGR